MGGSGAQGHIVINRTSGEGPIQAGPWVLQKFLSRLRNGDQRSPHISHSLYI